MSVTDTHFAICEEFGEIPEQGEWYGDLESAMYDDDAQEMDRPVIYEITIRKIRVGVKKVDWERA